jgi:hypothetical protein
VYGADADSARDHWGVDEVRKRPGGLREGWHIGGAAGHPGLVTVDAEAGDTILAGTGSRPHGGVADQIRARAAAGLGPHAAIAVGSWAAARSYPGPGGLTPGAPAHAVACGVGPQVGLALPGAPLAVVLRGRPVSR